MGGRGFVAAGLKFILLRQVYSRKNGLMANGVCCWIRAYIIIIALAVFALPWADSGTPSVGAPDSAGYAPPAGGPAAVPLQPPPVTEEPPPALPEAAESHARPVYNIDYTGASISAVIPGAGQLLYQGRYWMGAGFLAAEAAAVGFTVYWWDEANWRRGEAGRLRDSAAVIWARGEERGDSAMLYLSGLYGVTAENTEFDARRAKYTAYCALSWAVGIHIYSFLDALEAGGLTPHGQYRDPAKAGLLAAVPFLGLGQLYNGRPGKAGMIAMTQVSLMMTAYGHQRLMGYASERYNEMRDPESGRYAYRAEYLNHWKSRYDRSFSRRNTYMWISLATYLYSIFDAVVDAHLSDYGHKIDIGADLASGFYGGPSVMLTLTYRFY